MNKYPQLTALIECFLATIGSSVCMDANTCGTMIRVLEVKPIDQVLAAFAVPRERPPQPKADLQNGKFFLPRDRLWARS
jgi:hypothetical protein